MSKQEELLKLLLEKQIITQSDFEEARNLSQGGANVVNYLVKSKSIDPEKITEVKAEIYRMPYVNLMENRVQIDVLNIISFEAAKNYEIVCFSKEENIIKVGLTDPDNFKAMEAVNFLAKEENLQTEYYLISEASFGRIFKQYKNLKKEITTALETKAKEEADELSKAGKDKSADLEGIIKSAPVAKIVSVIIRHAVEGRASDIHIEPTSKESRVRYRIDGVLHTSLVLPRSVHNAVVARIKVLASLKLDETRIPQDGRIRQIVNDKAVDFRVSVMPLSGEEKVVMRVLDAASGAPTLEELGYGGRALDVVKDNIGKTTGMFLVTGPTGSGKSTTLFSVLNMLNKEGVNISTLEDPIEYFIQGVNQSQVRPEIGFSFATGLRSLLRQDPDIVMVGEIRDNETAELAIHAGLTGHFVLSTLHTNDALGAIPRLVDMKVEPFLLGSTLNAIMAQRLARRICSHCKRETKLPEGVLKEIKKEIEKMPVKTIEEVNQRYGDINKVVFYKGEGCSRCNSTGYSDRIAVVEALDISGKLKDKIMRGDTIVHTEEVKQEQGFITMRQDGIIKIIQGRTTMEEILRVMKN